jgi:tRNA G46 methylase TrmB
MNRRQEDAPPSLIPRYTWLLSRYPDFLASFTRPLREAAVRHLCLEPGSRVLDVGCGTGASFRFLVQAVGPEREVVGVEISQDLAAIARKRIEQEKWKNIHIAVGPAQTIPSQVGLMACCCSRRTRCSPRPKPWIICFPISKSRGASWRSGPNCQTRDEPD